MFDQLKPIMQNGERYIVVEHGKPEYVLMRFHDYATLVSGKKGNPDAALRAEVAHHAGFHRANAEIAEMRSMEPEVRAEPVIETALPQTDPATIRLEDLPL
jgi:hypothetical protein